MIVRILACVVCLAPAAWPLNCDLKNYRPQAGLSAEHVGGSLVLFWDGERGEQLRMRFDLDAARPVIQELEWRRRGGPWITAARGLEPEFSVVTGVRRTGHGLPEDLRWWVYWDAPLQIPGSGDQPNLPRKPDEVRRADATMQVTGCRVTSEGARLEISFDGLRMGIFNGRLQYTVYRGSNLIRQEAIARTEEPSVAFKYAGGLKGFATSELAAVAWRDTGGNPQAYEFGGAVNQNPVALRARNRIAIASGENVSVAVFPPPHQFFFARQLEVNLGYVWYRKDSPNRFALGIRHGENHEGYNQTWVDRVFALYNAPPGTWQRMPVYFHVTGMKEGGARDAALAYTRGDRYKALPGYKTMVTHFHTAFTKELTDSGSLDTQAPWIPAMRALGINIVYTCDFHGDGHPNDPGPVRLKELEDYYEACRRHSDRDFLILPGEEANAYLGGHYNILFPKPVYWTHRRDAGRSLEEKDQKYGTVWRTGSAADVSQMMKREGALVWQTHPRTKGSTGFPDKIREMEYFRGDNWLGGGFKALPVDLSEQRLCEKRCFDTLDDMNNWGRPKYLLAEVDTYKKFPEYDLFGDFNVNYVALDRLPDSRNWTPLVESLRAGRFFVSTGEVLITDFRVESGAVSANIEWTFPLEFVEVVFSDGDRVDRKIVPATDRAPFGSERFRIPVNLTGQKWVRLAAWDSAVNGAFTQPVHLK